MHYSAKGFRTDAAKANDLNTIDTKNGEKIGQRNGFSELDIVGLNKLYSCAPAGRCDVTSFVDVDKGVTCENQIGPCTVLADKMNSKYGTCRAYCAAQDLGCIRAWEERGDHHQTSC